MTSSISIVTIASALVLGVAAPSQAAVVVQGFSVAPDRWFDDGNPFGVGTNPSLSGSVTVNTADTTGTSFLAINYVTGSKIWSLADIDVGASRVNFDGMGNVSEFALVFSGGSNYVYSFNTVSIKNTPTKKYERGESSYRRYEKPLQRCGIKRI